jgi:hypothetical protein
MGVNFFTNTQNATSVVNFPARVLVDDVVPVTAFATPANLINTSTGIIDGDPGLFCIGCNNFVFQKSQVDRLHAKITQAPFSKFHPHMFIVDKPVGDSGGDEGQQSNSASIVAILAWKNVSSHLTTVSHYLAGDVLWEQEAALVSWLAPTCRVINIKLSHHGAAASSPASLFQLLKPVNVVVSAGASFGHPREFILSAMCPFSLMKHSAQVGNYFYG